MPTALHLALQEHYAGEDGQIEAPVGGYLADVLRGGVVYEVQTGNFSALRAKLADFAAAGQPVVLVHPIAQVKYLVRLDPETGAEIGVRRSPKRGSLVDLLRQAIYVLPLLAHETVELEVVLTCERELRRDDGLGSWRRGGVSLVGRELLEIVSTHRFATARDLLGALPEGLPEAFTVAELGAAGRLRPRMAARALWALRQAGVVKQVGKRGNAHLYGRGGGAQAERATRSTETISRLRSCFMPATDCIRIQNMSFYGYHGVDAEERRLGGKFSLDVEMYLDLRAAGEGDDLTRTVDYKAVYETVRRVHDGQHFLLLEALAHQVAQAILGDFAVEEVVVRVRKHSVPLQGLIDYTEVEIRRGR
jgi:dihydroneopterin aldolase